MCLLNVMSLCLQEVNFLIIDSSDSNILKSMETLLAAIVLPALTSQKVQTFVTHGCVLSFNESLIYYSGTNSTKY